MLDGLDDELDDNGSLAAELRAMMLMHSSPKEMYVVDDIFVRTCGGTAKWQR